MFSGSLQKTKLSFQEWASLHPDVFSHCLCSVVLAYIKHPSAPCVSPVPCTVLAVWVDSVLCRVPRYGEMLPRVSHFAKLQSLALPPCPSQDHSGSSIVRQDHTNRVCAPLTLCSWHNPCASSLFQVLPVLFGFPCFPSSALPSFHLTARAPFILHYTVHILFMQDIASLRTPYF